MLTGRNTCFLRLLLLFVKIIIVSKFPATVKTNVNINAVHHAMPSALEGAFSDNLWSFVRLTLAADVLFILRLYVKAR